MIERYTRPEMARIWSEETRLGHWLEIELGLVDVLAERGTVPREAAQKLRSGAKVNVPNGIHSSACVGFTVAGSTVASSAADWA